MKLKTVTGKQRARKVSGQLNIAFFIPWITVGRGGTENVGSAMANAMVRRGHKAVIYTFDDDDKPSLWPLEPEIKLVNLRHAMTPESEGHALMLLAVQKPDLIVGLHMSRDFFRYVYFAHRLDIPVMLSEHIDPVNSRRVGTFSEAERIAIFTGATRIHLLDESFRETLPDYLQERISVVPNTVFDAARPADPAGTENERILLAVARLEDRKNIDLLIEAFGLLSPERPEWRLQIVGTGPLLNNLMMLARTLGVAEKIDFIGHVDNVYEFYEQAQILVMPSLYEGLPLGMLEAMAHGLPLVGFEVCNGVNTLIKHGTNGLLATGINLNGSLSDDLARLMDDDSLRVKFGKASLQAFKKQYGNDVIHEKWEAMFRDAVAQYEGISPLSLQERARAKLDEMVQAGCSAAARMRFEHILKD